MNNNDILKQIAKVCETLPSDTVITSAMLAAIINEALYPNWYNKVDSCKVPISLGTSKK